MINRTSRRLVRSRIAALAAAAVVAGLGLVGVTAGPAAAHDEALHWENYEKITLTKDTGEPIDMAVMADGRVLHTARNGEIRLTDPDSGATDIVTRVPVYNNSEDGLQTVTLDPDFATNSWVYLYYAPLTMDAPYVTSTPTGSSPNTLPAGQTAAYWDQWKGYNQLTRAKWDEESDSIDLSTEQVILKVEAQRGQCCHVGGDVDFDDNGNVYLSTGDNTPASTPGANGFAPNNNAPGSNPGFDSRRGAGNTNDLRGAILRVHPEEDGSYTIPEGNLFAEGTELTRPEIFVMGVRNPFRMDVDPATNSVTWGDYGPDAGAADPARGPMGFVEWQSTSIDQPMNGGWPYCTADSRNYNEWDYATATPGPFFDCAAGAENNSTLNTGLAVLPPATEATLYYGDNTGDQPWPELTDFSPAGGQGPMGGPVYHYDADNPSTTKFPEYWDEKAFFAEFSQDYLAAFTMDWPTNEVTAIEQFLPNDALETNGQPITDSPIDIEFGPDGSLYVLDYGDGFFRQNPDAGLYRIDYSPGNKAPQAKITADPISSSTAPLTVEFDGSDSVDPEGGELTYEWDFDGDGTFDATGVEASYTYEELGRYTARLRVTDPDGRIGITSTVISVGNIAPTINLNQPANGTFFDWGQAVPFRITTDDPEDGTATVCSRLTWTFGLGHDQHAHPLSQGSGCTFADSTQGVEIVGDDTASGLRHVASFDRGDYLAYDPANLAGLKSVNVVGKGTGQIQLRWNSPTAPVFSRANVDSAEWSDNPTGLRTAPIGTGVLYVTSTGGVVLDSLVFSGDAVADVTAPTVTATTTPAAPQGANGWFTTDVTVAVAATDDGTVTSREVSTDGGTTWVSVTRTPLTVTTEGITTVLYRATDNGGNVSKVKSLTVKIDKTAPTASVTGVENGVTVGDSGQVSWAVADGGSGVASTTVTVDGATVAANQPLDLWRLSLGAHRMVVTGKDKAGLTTTVARSFTTTTSLAELSALTQVLVDQGHVTRAGGRVLQGHLTAATAAVADGDNDAAVRELRQFGQVARSTSVAPDKAASAALRRDANAVIGSLQ